MYELLKAAERGIRSVTIKKNMGLFTISNTHIHISKVILSLISQYYTGLRLVLGTLSTSNHGLMRK